jgi:glycosyltransferase involved in cell wall biosynthesis
MADIVNDYSNKWTYRILLGGYGGQKEDFLNMIADSWAVRDGRVDIVDYVERMEDVWDATKLFIFPSRFEGYGMSAVEPMMHGVPVMVQDYPSIREAVGDAAIIMPYGEDSKEWIETIEELFFDDEEYAEFKEKGYKRVSQLLDREHGEMSQFIEFMEKLV